MRLLRTQPAPKTINQPSNEMAVSIAAAFLESDQVGLGIGIHTHLSKMSSTTTILTAWIASKNTTSRSNVTPFEMSWCQRQSKELYWIVTSSMPSTPVLHNCMVHRCGKRRGGEVPISLLFPQSHFLNTTSSIQNLQKKKKHRNTRPQAPKKQSKRHNSAQRRQRHPEGDNHYGEEVNKTSCPTLHVFRVGICRRPMSSSPPPPVGCWSRRDPIYHKMH